MLSGILIPVLLLIASAAALKFIIRSFYICITICGGNLEGISGEKVIYE
jgi:hypothetical protein